MNKPIKTTVLFTLLLLFYSTAFAGGWQKNAYNIALDYYGNLVSEHANSSDGFLPTKDGGVLIYGVGGKSLDFFHFIIKFDKYGNLQWKKIINKPETVISDSNTVNLYYLQGGIIYYTGVVSRLFSVSELSNNRYLMIHEGPHIDSSFNNPCCQQIYTEHSYIKYFTILDSYGNIISRNYNLLDSTRSFSWSLNRFNAIKYDTINKSYTIFDIKRENGKNYLHKASYDTSFRYLESIFTLFDFQDAGLQNNYIQLKDSLIFISYDYTTSPVLIAVINLEGRLIYKLNSALIDSLRNKSIVDSVRQFYQLDSNCYSDTEILQWNRHQDYFIDKNLHIHLNAFVNYKILKINGNDTCKRHVRIFIHDEYDAFGNLLKTDVKNLANKIDIIDDEIMQPFSLDYNDSVCNIIMCLVLTKNFNHYDFMRYDFKNNIILNYNNFKNEGDLKDVTISPTIAYNPRKKSQQSNYNYMAFTRFNYEWSIYYILKIDSLGNINNHIIQGNVFADQNNNCIKNVNDKNLPQITVTTQHQDFTAYTSSDNNGNYSIGIGDSGTYTITALPNNTNYPLFAEGSCSQGTTYAYRDSITFDTLNLALKPIIFCPLLYVDISTPLLRRCFSSIYTVNYKNNGSIASPATYVDITLDRFLTVNSASKPYTNLGNNVLRFQLGNVDYFTSGSFTIDVTVRCDSTLLGQTHCVEAHIYPDTVCAVANYTGPVISASVQCKIDSVEFKLKNTGGNMQQPKRYIVIEDNLNRMNGNFQLNNNQQQLITLKADSGKTYGIIAEQDENFPTALGDKFATAFIEGCNPLNNSFTTGIITQYPEFDGEAYRSVDCQQNIGAYDPNDKTGYPIGVSSNHFIEKNTAIDYKINFQNTGTDTAFKVVIVDTISKYLDINTIEPGASSHLYTFMRTDSNTIKFIFDSIKLIDSNKNEKLSHGFVKFRIQQKANNANGTKIYNQAEIYFDYNSPIFTNTTTHTIGEIYVRILSATINPKYLQANIKVFPNPFREIATIDLQNLEQQKTTLILFDISGKEILQLQSNTNKYEINGNALEKGMYLFKIQNDNEEIANGKLVVQ